MAENISTSGSEYQYNNVSLDVSMDVSETNSCAETTSSNNTGATSDSNNGASSAGGIAGGLAKSARYKMAMTTRARQRRLRRMRDPSGGPCSGGSAGGDMENGTIGDAGGEEQLTPPPSSHSRGEVRSSGTVIHDASSDSAALPPALPQPYSSSFAEHSYNVIDIPPIKLYDSNTHEFGHSTPSKPGAPITASAPSTPSTVGETPPRHSPSNSVSSRSNSRTLFPVSTYESPLSAAASSVTHRNSSPISTTTATREENESIRENMGGMRSTPSPHIMTTTSNAHSQQLHTTPRTTRQSAIRAAALREQPNSAIAQTTKEFIPNWDTDILHHSNGSVTCVGLSDDAIREASNFTKIQFQCSGQGGEVEMVSGDEITFDAASDDVTKKMNGGYCDLSPSSIPSAIGGIGEENDDEENNNDDQGKQVWQNDLWSDVSVHSSSMAQYDIFHQKAASNLVSLLSPNRMIEAGLMAPEINSCEEDDAAKDVRGDSPWGEEAGSPGVSNTLKEGNLTSTISSSSSAQDKKYFTFDANPNDSRGGEWKGVVQVNRTLFRDDLDDDVKQSMLFQAFRKNMMEPSQQLKDLLLQIHRDRFTPLDRTNATRRKNSCGALKILSAKEENKLMICWTVGVLPAIASVMSDVCAVRETDDASTYAANTEARNRIIATLLNLSVNKKNRMLIVNTPGVLDSMTQTILHDTGEGRQGCCTVFLYLAKTAEARMMIVKGVGVMDALAKVIEMPKAKVKERKPSSPKAKMRRRLIENYKSMDNEIDTTPDSRRCRVDNRRNSRRYQSSIDYSDSDSVNSNSSNSSNSSTVSGDVTEYTEVMSIRSEIMVANTVEMTFSTADTASIANVTKSDRSAVTTIEHPSEDMYDADPNRFLHGARLSVFACLLCLVKSQELAFIIARDAGMIETLIEVSTRHPSPSHSRAVAVIAHLTRHPRNSHELVFHYGSLLPALMSAVGSPDKEARRYAVCALQNLSIDKSCRTPVAHSPNVIWSLSQRCMDTSDEEYETRIAAMATLQNLSDEPANVIQFTIVENCIDILFRVASADSMSGDETDLLCFMAKNTLATLSHWFRKIATGGAERARQSEMASSGVRGGITSSSNNRAFLHNATLNPTFYELWA